MDFFGRGVEVGTKEAMVAVGALRSCGSLGFAAAEALMVFVFLKKEREKERRRKKEERKKRWNQSVLMESAVVDGVNSTGIYRRYI
jgi:hypothetical protein